MTAPTPLCPNPMLVHRIIKETPEVTTLQLLPEGGYPYQPGQYALVSIQNRGDLLRAYTISSSPGLSPFITLTVRALSNGVGSQWLTSKVRTGDTLWISDAQGEFTCTRPDTRSDRYLMLAGGCGVTPVMSMTRWLLANDDHADLCVFYSMRTPGDLIFAEEWHTLAAEHQQRLRLFLIAEENLSDGFLPGRLSLELLRKEVPDTHQRMVMTCGPAVYMKLAEQWSRQLGVPPENFHKEQFHTAAECIASSAPSIALTIEKLGNTVQVPAGTTLLQALEQHGASPVAACRSGVCGACKTRVVHGNLHSTSQATLTPEELQQGYVLACCSQLQEDTVIV